LADGGLLWPGVPGKTARPSPAAPVAKIRGIPESP
jgi:hypothetical protein